MVQKKKTNSFLSQSELAELKRWSTPAVFNGWEQITSLDFSSEGFNVEETHDFMPQMGSMVGYTKTAIIEPSNPKHESENPDAWNEYRQYIAEGSQPKIVVVQDLDKPNFFGAFCGEVNSNIYLTLGCVGSIIDGAIRDVNEMIHVGFKVLAKSLCVGHAHSFPVRWGCEVEVFGRKVRPDQLIHADIHGFLVIPSEDEKDLLEATQFMDSNERQTFISTARKSRGIPTDKILLRYRHDIEVFDRVKKNKFKK